MAKPKKRPCHSSTPLTTPSESTPQSSNSANASSAVTEPAPSPLRFHSDYDRATKGVTLQASDGLCFGSDLDLLAQHSTFFHGLKDIPRSASSIETDAESVVKVGVCSEALRYCLSTMGRLKKYRPLRNVNKETISDILIFADKYDMSSIYHALYTTLQQRQEAPYGPNNTVVLFLVACFCRNKQDIAALLPATLPYRVEFRSGTLWWARLLRNHLPIFADMIESFFRKSLRAFKKFESQVISNTQTARGALGLNLDARRQWLGHVPSMAAACRNAVKFEHNFQKFELHCLPRIWKHLRADPKCFYESSPLLVESLVRKLDLKCDCCVQQLVTDISSPLWNVTRVTVAQAAEVGRKGYHTQ